MVLTSAAKDVRGEYELIILHPAHFLTGGHPMLIKHPTTGLFALFYRNEDGFLHEGCSFGPRLPTFSSRGNVNREVPLNPVLVNFAAYIRMRRLDRQCPGWRGMLHPDAQKVLDGVEKLHRAVTMKPGRDSERSSASVETPSQVPAPGEPNQPGSPSPEEGHTRITEWEDAYKLIMMHTGNFRSW